jgi:3-phosphoshikimate 1-carboxyvinyltransferase
MTAPMVHGGLSIHITSEKTDGSYIRITRKMMKDFGCMAQYDGHDYLVEGGQSYKAGDYRIEPDVSAACYFYAMAAITGGRAMVYHVDDKTTQGDIRFLKVLEDMGCRIENTPDGIAVTGPLAGKLHAVSVDMNDFSDQALTLAAIAPFADGPVEIRNIAHIRGQECDRLHAMAVNLSAMGIRYEEREDGITIYPGKPHGCRIQTFDDHRVAMAFSLAGTVTEGIVVENPECCRKTFENYFEILDAVCEGK